MSDAPSDAPPLPFREAIKSFRGAFWAANTMEMLERLGYYGVRVVVGLYIASSEEATGLHFTNEQKGTIFGLWALVQTLVPMFSGGFSDRYGRKQTIVLSVLLDVCGYSLMATQRSFGGFLAGCLTLGLGTAIFKPGLWGTVALCTEARSSSLGWGIFYWVVNVGGALGPPLAGFMRHNLQWRWVFLSSAAIMSLNLLMLLSYDDPAGKSGKGAPLQVFLDSVVKLVRRPRALGFVVVMGLYFVMFMQLYDSLPNFIEEWTDSSDVIATLGLGRGQLAQPTTRGLQIPQEWMINLDAASILLLVVPVSAVAARMKLLRVMVVGILLTCVGLLLAGRAATGWACLLGIFVFAWGEMLSVPKVTEFLGLIAPKGEEALYMGYANIPFAIGWASGTYVAGHIYDAVADKANLATRYLVEHAHVSGEIARTEAMARLQQATGLDPSAATRLLWETYHPYTFWYGFVAVGLASAVGLYVYARAFTR